MRRLRFFLIGVLGVVVFAAAVNAWGQSCGFVMCEGWIAGSPSCASPALNCHCEIRTPPNVSSMLCWAPGTPSYPGCSEGFVSPACNCAARPDWSDPSGPRSFYDSMDGSGNVKKCIAGCTFVPKGNYAADKWMATDSGGKYAAFAPDGWQPDGSQCDPIQDGAGPDPSPEEENCSQAGDAIVCIDRKPDDSGPPKNCLYYQGQEICEDDPNACSGGAAIGFFCVETPDNSPEPPPPPEGPPPTRPPDLTNPCIVNGVPCEIRYWEPPFGSPCAEGWHRENGVCVPDDALLCPDGSQPVNGQCPAPEEVCPDGSLPVNGQCVAPWQTCPNGSPPVNGACEPVEGQCPGGTEPENGLCSPEIGDCPNGDPPVNGMCQATFGTCPNGSQPVNGQCSMGSCDPATDPNQCQGNENGHASGGQTCAAPPACVGDMILCMNVNQTWRTRCAVEALGGDGSEPGEDDYGPATDGSAVWGDPGDGGTGIDSGGWIGGGGGECPSLGVATFHGESYAISDWVPCSALRILATLILVGGLAQGAYIIGRG